MWKTTITESIKTTSIVYYRNILGQANAGFYAQEDLGLSFGNMPSMIWELIPYSFVVDWVVNVGDWLKASRPRLDLEIMGSCTSHHQSVTNQRICVASTRTDTGASVIPTTSMYTSELQKLLRVSTAPLPVYPQVAFEFDNLIHNIDSLTLIHQRIPR